MNTRIFALAIALPALVLGACSSTEEAPEPTSSTKTSSSTSSTSTTTSSKTPNPTKAAPREPEAIPEPAPAPPQPEQPYIVECLFGTPGPTLMSDGTTQHTEYCANQPGAQQYLEEEGNAGLPQTPSPWVQGQIDWSECISAGNTAEECRARLN